MQGSVPRGLASVCNCPLLWPLLFTGTRAIVRKYFICNFLKILYRFKLKFTFSTFVHENNFDKNRSF